MPYSISRRVSDLGKRLPPPGEPVANYRNGTRAGSLIYLSGQIPMRDGRIVFAGRVGESLDFRQGADAAELAALNLLAHLAHAIGDDIRRVEQIVRLGVFIACAPEFTGHAAVANGASDLIVRVLGERGRHARTAIGVASLPGGAAVEIDAIALSCD